MRAFALALAALAFAAVPCAAQQQAPAPDRAEAEAEPAARRLIRLDIGRATMIQTDWPVSRVSVADPDIADVQVIEPRQVMVLARSVGTTDLVLWAADDRSLELVVQVEVDLNRMREQLAQFFPGARLTLDQSGDVLVVRGALSGPSQAQQLEQFLATTDLKYSNMTSIAGVQQVMLRVRVAEASRQALRSLGINAFHVNNGFFGASTIGGNANNIDIGVPGGVEAADNLPFVFQNPTSVSSAVTLFAGFPDADLQLFVDALAENQFLRVLAEPTLVALSGEEASFLAGGEFPIPVVQSTGAATGTSITIEFKEFGVRLAFRPTVLGDGAIRLRVSPEVSDLSDIGAVEIEGFRIPSILTRRASTTLEMNSGQTFAMAGLIDRSITARTTQVPGLGSLPVVGALFRSVRYERGETELLVLVTASLVEPMTLAGKTPVPGDLHSPPDDWALYADGRIEAEEPAVLSPAHTDWLRRMGLDRLRGPGAWTDYEQPPAPSRAAPADDEP